MKHATQTPTGELSLKVVRRALPYAPGHQLSNEEIMAWADPAADQPDEVNDWRIAQRDRLHGVVNGFGVARAVAQEHGLPYMWSQLWMRVKRAGEPNWLEYGLAGCKVVTTAGVNFIVDSFQGTADMTTLEFHALGTTNTAEAAGDTTMAAEITTQYAVDNTRPTGTNAEGASANIYRSVGTNTVDGAVAAVEHGLFSASSGGTLLDRTVFTVINLASGDTLESTYEITFVAGS